MTNFVAECHAQGIRVILDGVFNHTGRDFFAFQDIKQHRENSRYKDWYCKVNFRGNNSFHDGFSYENWCGHDLLVKLNQHNPAVKDYICDVIRFWVSEFDIDGIRLDAADVLDFAYMRALREVANEVTLYTFVDNHDVERIYTKLSNKAHFLPIHIMLYTLPGIPSVYYGSEFGIEGRKERFSDDSLRPALHYEDYKDAIETNPCTKLIAVLGKIRRNTPALSYGDYKELLLQTTHFAYASKGKCKLR